MRNTFQLEVCRNSDKVMVAQTMPAEIRSYTDQGLARIDAKRLSRVYGKEFHVEVWTHYEYDGGNDYHRAYVMQDGKTVCAVGF